MTEYSANFMGQEAQRAFNAIASGYTGTNITAIKTGNYVASTNDEIILVSGTMLPLIIQLPSVGVDAGKTYTIKEISSFGIGSNITSGSILVTGVSSVRIDGYLTGYIPVGNRDNIIGSGVSRKTYVYDGSAYWNIG